MDRGTQALITTIVFTVLAGIFIILRSISRFFIVKRPGVEDYLIIFAFVLSIGLAVDVDLQRDNGLGKHTASLPLHKVENTLKVRQASQLPQKSPIELRTRGLRSTMCLMSCVGCC